MCWKSVDIGFSVCYKASHPFGTPFVPARPKKEGEMTSGTKANVGIGRLLLTSAVLVWLFSQLAWGAVTGRISGTVKDPTGAVVPGAQIVVLETQTGIKTESRTDTAGFYSFPSLAVGHYE